MLRNRRGRKKAGGASWLTTYSDLMNLLLCFFVMLYAISTVNSEKFEQIRDSFAEIGTLGSGLLPGGEGIMDGKDASGTGAFGEEAGSDAGQVKEEYLEEQRANVENLLREVEGKTKESGLSGNGVTVEADYEHNCVVLNIEGAVLFESGETALRSGALPVMSKIGDILKEYGGGNMIEIVGHTDNVPVKENGRYRDNNELSTARALSAFYYFVREKGISPAQIKYSGRGEYEPVATNETEEGRQKNRRIEIRIYANF